MKLMRAALQYLGERVWKKIADTYVHVVTQFVTEQIMIHWW